MWIVHWQGCTMKTTWDRNQKVRPRTPSAGSNEKKGLDKGPSKNAVGML